MPPYGPHRTVVDERMFEFSMVPGVAKDVDVADFDQFAILQTVEANEDIVLWDMRDSDALVADLCIDCAVSPHVFLRVSEGRRSVFDSNHFLL